MFRNINNRLIYAELVLSNKKEAGVHLVIGYPRLTYRNQPGWMSHFQMTFQCPFQSAQK